jgi:protease IV
MLSKNHGSITGLGWGRMLTVGVSLLAAAGLPVAATPSVAVLEIKGTPAEMQSGFTLLGDSGAPTLLGLIETLDTLAVDDEFSGVLIRLKDPALGYTQVEELAAAIRRVRDAGKRVDLFAEGYGTTELLLGSHVDQVLMQSGGMVSFPGMFMEEMFLADTLSWVGVKAQLVQVGDYKGANEQMTRTSPSPQWDQNITSLLDGMYGNMRSDLTEGRNLTGEQLDEAMKIAWMANGTEAIESGLIDAEVDLPSLPEWLKGAYGESVRSVSNPYAARESDIDFSNPFAILSQLGKSSEIRIDQPTIAVLHINGTIMDGDSSSGGLFGGGSSVGSRTVRNAIEQIMKEDLIKGVIVRVDSPGGSAIASEVMWQGLQRLKTEKPVWVSVGSMAASGGFYVLSAGDRVFVNPSSIVGSIGVVGGKYSMGELYDKAKIHIVERSRGPAANLFASSEAWGPRELYMIRDRMAQTYDLFTSRVEAGRPGIDLSKTAEGRLFVGSDAIDLNMADAIGGLDEAVNQLAAEVDLSDFEVVHYPAPPSLEKMLEQMLGGFVQAPSLTGTGHIAPGSFGAMLRGVLGEHRYRSVVDSLNGITLLQREPVLLVNPRTIIIR